MIIVSQAENKIKIMPKIDSPFPNVFFIFQTAADAFFA